MNAAQSDLTVCRDVAVKAAEAAGHLVRSGFNSAITCESKGTTGDVVTSLDLGAEQLIVDCLHDAFPSHRIASEESGAARNSSGPWTWLVDPLDGSNNIVVGLPVVAIGLALCYDNLYWQLCMSRSCPVRGQRYRAPGPGKTAIGPSCGNHTQSVAQ
jgi:myo-inositol-1(or 4)-monophosphatase